MCFGGSSERDTSAPHPNNNLNSRLVSKPKSIPPKTSRMPQETYASPLGPPPNYQNQFAAPPGPPPSHQQEQYAPPPGPPPSQAPQHNWQTAVPDTSLLPPPPSVGYQQSPTNNAAESDANAAEQWLRNRPLQQPLPITDPNVLRRKSTTLVAPPTFHGTIQALSPGRYHVKTKSKSPDACITSSLPLYSVSLHSALAMRHHATKTIYFEVKLLPGSRTKEISLALGFLAQPYPPFRLPGWERASLGVHGDDGHRYVNDKWGGRDFTRPFRRGETVGIGMRFSRKATDQPFTHGEKPMAAAIDVEVFFTRNGKRDGGWDIHEELDAQEDLPITGLEGAHDLYAAVGTFDAVEFEVRFAENDWLYNL